MKVRILTALLFMALVAAASMASPRNMRALRAAGTAAASQSAAVARQIQQAQRIRPVPPMRFPRIPHRALRPVHTPSFLDTNLLRIAPGNAALEDSLLAPETAVHEAIDSVAIRFNRAVERADSLGERVDAEEWASIFTDATVLATHDCIGYDAVRNFNSLRNRTAIGGIVHFPMQKLLLDVAAKESYRRFWRSYPDYECVKLLADTLLAAYADEECCAEAIAEAQKAVINQAVLYSLIANLRGLDNPLASPELIPELKDRGLESGSRYAPILGGVYAYMQGNYALALEFLAPIGEAVSFDNFPEEANERIAAIVVECENALEALMESTDNSGQ